ncbi:hypothetical protein ACLB1N_01150 [Escherichia coli]
MEAACQPARKPLAGWRLPEGKRATLARSPLPFPFVMCPMYSDVIFLWLPCLLLFFFLFLFPFLSCLWLSRASPWRGGLS